MHHQRMGDIGAEPEEWEIEPISTPIESPVEAPVEQPTREPVPA